MIGKALKITNDRKQNIANKFLGTNEKKHIDKVFLGTQGQLFQRVFFQFHFIIFFFGGGCIWQNYLGIFSRISVYFRLFGDTYLWYNGGQGVVTGERHHHHLCSDAVRNSTNFVLHSNRVILQNLMCTWKKCYKLKVSLQNMFMSDNCLHCTR